MTSDETQAAASVVRVREPLIRQRTQTIDALRGHPTESGEVSPRGVSNIRRRIALIEAPDSALPEAARAPPGS